MSFLIAAREMLTTAATDLGNIGSALRPADLTAATPTTGNGGDGDNPGIGLFTGAPGTPGTGGLLLGLDGAEGTG